MLNDFNIYQLLSNIINLALLCIYVLINDKKRKSMDLYSTIINQGGKLLQDGSAWRDIVSKDGSKIIRQIAQKNGTSAIDVFQKNGQVFFSYRKEIRPDGKSYLTKAFHYIKQNGQIQSVLKLDQDGSFMQTLFKTNNKGQIKPLGKFMSKAQDQIRKTDVTFFPPVGKVNPNDSKLKLFVDTFNKMFGKQESKIF